MPKITNLQKGKGPLFWTFQSLVDLIAVSGTVVKYNIMMGMCGRDLLGIVLRI